MKKSYLILFALIIKLNLYGQTRVKLDENSIVKDSTGKVYDFKEWKTLSNSGVYKINSTEKVNEFLIEPLEVKYNKVDISSRISTGEKYYFRKFETIDGTKYKPTDFEGKIVVINFWFVNCKPCRIEMPELNKLKAEFANNKDIIFLSFSLDNEESIHNLLRVQNFNYQIVPNAMDYAIMNEVKSYPTNLVIDKQGIIAASYVGLKENNIPRIKQIITNLSK